MLEKAKMDKFAKDLVQAYGRNSILKNIAQIIDFDHQVELSFSRIGESIQIPKHFFVDDVDNSVVAGQLAMSVAWGEENFITNYLIEKATTENNVIKLKEFSRPQLVDAILRRVNCPTDIFIPINEPYYFKVHDWLPTGTAKYENHDLYILIGNSYMKVKWSTKFTPLKHIVVLDKNKMKIIQKKFEQIIVPSDFGQPLYSYEPGSPIRLDVGNYTPEDFRLFYRTVIAIEQLQKDAYCVIEPPEIE